MDNQKSQTGNGSNFNKDSSGKELHKDAGNHMGSTGGNKGSMGSDASKQFDSAKSLDQNKSTDMNKGSDQHKGSEQKSAVTNNAFDSKPAEQNKQFDQSKSSDLNKSSDASKPVEFPKAGMASASTASTASSYDSTAKPADLAARTDSAHDTIDKARDAAQPMADRLATSAHAGVDKVSNALTGASARMEDKTRQLSEAYQHFADSGREYVRSSPATSVLVALAAGYTLSKLFGRR